MVICASSEPTLGPAGLDWFDTNFVSGSSSMKKHPEASISWPINLNPFKFTNSTNGTVVEGTERCSPKRRVFSTLTCYKKGGHDESCPRVHEVWRFVLRMSGGVYLCSCSTGTSCESVDGMLIRPSKPKPINQQNQKPSFHLPLRNLSMCDPHGRKEIRHEISLPKKNGSSKERMEKTKTSWKIFNCQQDSCIHHKSFQTSSQVLPSWGQTMNFIIWTSCSSNTF